MSTTPNVPQSTESFDAPPSALPRWVLVVFIVVFVMVGYLLYASHEARTSLENELAKTNEKTKVLTAQVEQTNARLENLKVQADVTSQKLGITEAELARARGIAQAVRKEQEVSAAKLGQQIGQVKQESEAKLGQVSTELGGAKTDIEATRKDLEATKGRLERTVGDLGVASGLIARNREDVEALKRLGERNIFEFDLHKSKSPQRVGPVQIVLQKVDTKKYKYTMTVTVDDKQIEKKDKTVQEPVQFYVKGSRSPYEIVVFDVSKDRATGYLSTPKDAPAAASATPAKQ